MNKSLQAEHCIYLSTCFHGHPFVKSVLKEFGPKGYAVVTAVLLTIRRNGREATYRQGFIQSILDFLPDVSGNLVDMIVRKMVKAGFLDSEVFHARKALTPPAEYIAGTISEVFSDVSRPYVFIMTPVDNYKSVNPEETAVYSEETIVNSEETAQCCNFSVNNVASA